MIHVVDFEKTAFSTPFRGDLPPFGPQISAESGRATHSLAPEKPGWPPTSTWPLFSRPTPHVSRLTLDDVRPAGSGRAQTFPAGYCLSPTAEFPMNSPARSGGRGSLVRCWSGRRWHKAPPRFVIGNSLRRRFLQRAAPSRHLTAGLLP